MNDIVTDFRSYKQTGDKDAAHANLLTARGEDPDKAARVDALAKKWGVGVDTARVQQPALETAARVEADQAAIADAPKTATFLAKPENAAVSHDHVPDLSRVESLVKQKFPAFTSAQHRQDVVANLRPLGSPVLRAAVGPRPTAQTVAGGLYHNFLIDWALAREGTRAYTADMVGIPAVVEDANKKTEHLQWLKELNTPSFKSGLAASVFGGVESLLGTIPAISAGVATRNPGLAIGLMGGQTGLTSYGKYRARGGTANEALAGGVLEGGIETATEMIPMGFLVKRLGKAGFKEFAAKFVGQEMATEQLATFLQDATDTAIANPNKTWGDFWKERPQAAFDTAVAVGVAAGGLGAVNHTLGRMARDDARAENAKPQADAFNDLVKATTAMPLRERAPEQFAEYLDHIAEGVDVHLNAGAVFTYLQSVQPEEAQAFIDATGIAQQLATATREVDIVIPAATYLQQVGPTPAHKAFEQDIKVGPHGMSLREAEEHKGQREQLLAETAARALQAGVDTTGQDPVERVRQHFYDQAVAVGVPEAQAQQNAAVQAAYYEQRAARNSTYGDAWEAYAAANVSMEGQGTRTEGPRSAAGPASAVFNIFEQKPQDPKKLAAQVPGLAKVLPYLTEEERANLSTVAAKNLISKIATLPKAEEMASVAYAGRAKRGWYEKSAQAILEVFGAEDAPRFAALLAALSPQTSVESNAVNALNVWVKWDAAGRPTTKDEIHDILGEGVQGGKGRDSVMDAWVNNSVRALSTPDPGAIRLSGPKVNSFMNNLVGVVDEVTNDAWMANYALIDQEMFAGAYKDSDALGKIGGKSTGYLAMSAVVRKAAQIVTQRTGEVWTPAEIQETVWSWAKTLYEKRDSMGDTTAEQLLQASGLTHEDIGGTPDFAALFAAGVYRKILEEGGYGQALDAIAADRGAADRLLGDQSSVFSGEGAGIAEPAYQRHLVRAARRIERRRYDAREARFAQSDDELITLSHFSDKGRISQLDPEMWGENWDVLPTEEKMRVGEAPGRVYWGVGTGARGQYQPELGIGGHRYEAKVPASRLYDIDADPEGYRQQAQAEVAAQLDEGDSLEEVADVVTSIFEQKIKDAGWLGYRSRNPEIGDVVATFEPVKHTYKGKYAEPSKELPPGEPLEGLPRRIKVDGKTVTFGPFEPARDAARAYMEANGRPYNPPTTYAKVDEDRAKRIAQAYENMAHDPHDPRVRAAYDAMVRETLAQWQFIKATGLKVEFNEGGKDPYGNPRNAILDVVENNHLWIFPTEEGFGSGEEFEPSDSPLLAPVPDENFNGKPVVVNDIFRVVHDYFGHIKEGVGFRADGEENAWRVHSSMYSPLARKAMTTETRGQNSWVNFGPKGEQNKNASGADTVYADQKVGLMPDWVVEDGAAEPAFSFEQSLDDLGVKTAIEQADAALDGPAGRAVDSFVGLRHDSVTHGATFGLMSARGLEALFAPDASAEAVSARGALEEAFAPIREQLRNRVGDTIRLYRAQGPVVETDGINMSVGEDGKRRVLSWTSNPDVAADIAGVRQDVKLFTEADIAEAEKTFAETGEVAIGTKGRRLKLTHNEGYHHQTGELVAFDSVDIYHYEEMITDTESVRAYMEDINEDRQAFNDRNAAALQTVVAVDTPLDEVVWVTGRANQSEFIVRNRPGHVYIDEQGVLQTKSAEVLKQGPRGQVSFGDQGALIELFKGRNASTLVHEAAGHIWLENLAKDAADPNATDEVREDLEKVKAWWRANIAQAAKESGLPEKRLLAAVNGYGGVRTTLDQIFKQDPRLTPAIRDDATGKVHRAKVGEGHGETLYRLRKAGVDTSTIENQESNPFVFVNQKGHVLEREKALQFAVDNGLIKPEYANTSWAKNPVGAGLASDFLDLGERSFEQDGQPKKDDVEAIRPFHEMFARAAERYFMEGRSPTPGLRQAFAKFRQWLVAIYKDFTRLNVPMSDEIRGVFDRLIAGEQAVADATIQQGLGPFFPDAESAGFTPAEYEAYLKALQIADETANDRMLGKVMADIRKRRTAEWKAERQELVDQYQEQVDQMAEMKALTLLENGDARLQRAAVTDMLAKVDAVEGSLYRRSRPYVFDEGLHPDEVAEQVGMDSGQELVDALLRMREEHDALRAEGDKRTVRVARAEAAADQEMLARHGDILNDGTIGDEAVAAIHDMRRSEVLMAEVRALIRKAGAVTAVWSEAEMKAWAGKQIDARQLSGIRPHVYAMAEAKAGRDALKALVVDDFQAALDAKFRQLLNMHLYRAARNAREEIEKGKTLFDRIVKARNGSISKTRDMDMVSAARMVLMPYGFGAQANDEDYMAKVARYDPDLWADIGPTVTAALAGARPVDELTYDQFTSLREVIGQLWEMSRTSKYTETELGRIENEEIANDLSQGLGNVAPRPGDRAPTRTEQGLRLVSGVRAALRRVESWVGGVDGGTKGPWRTYIWQPVSEAAARFRLAKADYLNRFVALLDPVAGSLKRGKIPAPELGYTFGYANSGVGKSELLHALLHTGNDSNKRKLLLGRGWATERADGTLDTSAWDRFLDRMHQEGTLTKADYDFAQSVWDLLDEMKPAAQKAHRQVFGRYFEEVTANPVVSPFGIYRGGYVPALVDTFLVQEQAINAQADALTEANDATMFPSPNKGFTKARVEYNRPLILDLGVLPQHIDKVLKFSHMLVPARQVLRLLKDKTLSSTLEAFDPVAVPDLLLPWLNRSAKQIVETPSKGSAGKAADNFWRTIRHRTGMGIMIGNISNTMQQLVGWAPAALRVRKRFLTTALLRWLRNPKQMAEDVSVMSDFMATRIDAAVYEQQALISDLLLDPSKYEQVSKFTQKHAYVLQSATQNLVDVVTWQGAFEQATVEGQDYAEAVRYADSAVRETQGSLAPEDVSRFETGSPFVRAFTQFYSYFSGQSNLLTTELKNAKTVTRVGYVYALGFAVPAIVSDMIRRSFGEGWDDGDDDGFLDTWLDTFFGSQFRYGAGMIPAAGPLLVNVANRFNDKTYDDKLTPAPAFSSVEQIAGIPKDVYKLVTEGKNQKATVRDSATLLTLLTGVPWFNLAARPAGYLADINEGKTDPTGPVDFTRGLMTGTSSKASKVQ